MFGKTTVGTFRIDQPRKPNYTYTTTEANNRYPMNARKERGQFKDDKQTTGIFTVV